MDLRRDRLGILCCGIGTPGVNGIISSVTIEALKHNIQVLGIYDGFSKLSQGHADTINLTFKNTTRIFNKAGSILRTSKKLNDISEINNVLRALEYLRIVYLVIIGGTNTALSTANLLKEYIKNDNDGKYSKISIVFVPKSIFNDLPLPNESLTFGHSTAKAEGSKLVSNFVVDARVSSSWYIVTIGSASKTGHLAVEISKTSALTLCIIPEQFFKQKINNLTLNDLVDIISCTIYKRLATNKNYGTVIIAQGILYLLKESEIKKTFVTLENAKENLAQEIVKRLRLQFQSISSQINNFYYKDIGAELYAAKPNQVDVSLTRDLGFGAVRYLLGNGNGDIIYKSFGQIKAISLLTLANNLAIQSKYVQLNHINYQVSKNFMIRINQADLLDQHNTDSILATIALLLHMTIDQFLIRYKKSIDFSINDADNNDDDFIILNQPVTNLKRITSQERFDHIFQSNDEAIGLYKV